MSSFLTRKAKIRLEPVEVYCRIKPLQDSENESCLKAIDDTGLILQIPEVNLKNQFLF